MIYVGIDDTDVIDSPGTNKLARHLIENLGDTYRSVVAVRHQLLFDRRIPYTSKNSSASILFQPLGIPQAFQARQAFQPDTRAEADRLDVRLESLTYSPMVQDLAARIRAIMRRWFVHGSDPGLCVTEHVPPEITSFGSRCKNEIVTQEDARSLASRHGIYLEGLGGTEGGVIGALAAVGLIAGGNDGRVVSIGCWPDDLSGLQDVRTLHERGVAEVRSIGPDAVIAEGMVDVGKHLRPNYRDGRVVLFVEPAAGSGQAAWRAVRLL
jgi:tRNA(Ile2) C34 agmatinyltransferase TiaS